MMNWFFKWLRDRINQVDRDSSEEESKYDRAMKIGMNVPRVRPKGAISPISKGGEVNLNQQPLHFKIYPATGGHIVEYTFYNERKDMHDQALHLIPSELDLGAELAKIMTLEALKR